MHWLFSSISSPCIKWGPHCSLSYMALQQSLAIIAKSAGRTDAATLPALTKPQYFTITAATTAPWDFENAPTAAYGA